jgi:hypothetical protein
LKPTELAALIGGRPAAGARAACPQPELLAAAARGDASAVEREAIADHLGGCPDCADEYRLAAEVARWAAADGARQPSSSRPSRDLGFYARAASLAAVGIGLLTWSLALRSESERLRLDASAARQERDAGADRLTGLEARVARLQSEVEAARQPQLNTPIVDLEPGGELRGAPAGERAMVIPSSAERATLVLATRGGDVSPEYEVELVTPSGAWTGTGLVRNRFGTFTLALPSRLLPEGEMRLRVYGKRGGNRTLVEEYAFRVRRP